MGKARNMGAALGLVNDIILALKQGITSPYLEDLILAIPQEERKELFSLFGRMLVDKAHVHSVFSGNIFEVPVDTINVQSLARQMIKEWSVLSLFPADHSLNFCLPNWCIQGQRGFKLWRPKQDLKLNELGPAMKADGWRPAKVWEAVCFWDSFRHYRHVLPNLWTYILICGGSQLYSLQVQPESAILVHDGTIAKHALRELNKPCLFCLGVRADAIS